MHRSPNNVYGNKPQEKLLSWGSARFPGYAASYDKSRNLVPKTSIRNPAHSCRAGFRVHAKMISGKKQKTPGPVIYGAGSLSAKRRQANAHGGTPSKLKKAPLRVPLLDSGRNYFL